MTKPSTIQRLAFPSYAGAMLAARLKLPAEPRPCVHIICALFHPLEILAGGHARVFMGELAGIKAGTRTFSPLMGAEINARGKAPLQLPFTRKCYDVHLLPTR